MKQVTQSTGGQVVYFSHGGGPLPLLGDPSHRSMVDFIMQLPRRIREPESILVISAHWEEDIATVQSGEVPSLMYDYYGFPAEAYSITYPCRGNPSLALTITRMLEQAGMPCAQSDSRPYDHGSYIPLKLMYPQADIPVVQLSLLHNLNPLDHLSLGRALRPLLSQRVLVIGSGFSFHNMRQFDFSGGERADALNDQFQDRLTEICCFEETEAARWDSLASWDRIAGARYCHPREEHLLPLLVCAGLAEGTAVKVFDDYILGKRSTAFLWG